MAASIETAATRPSSGASVVLTLADQLLFLAVVAVGCYVQAVTGFALGLIVVAGAALFDLMSIEFASIVVSMITLSNTGLALRRSRGQVRWSRLIPIMVVAVPSIFVGLTLLQTMSVEHQDLLRLALGVTIIVSSISLVINPKPLAGESSSLSFAFLGGISGVLGGMFAAFGPPIIFHFYRQPLSLAVIRDSLLMTFLLVSAIRLALIVGKGMLPLEAVLQAAMALPVTIIFTMLGGKLAPPLAEREMRRLAFILLMLAGVAVLLPAV